MNKKRNLLIVDDHRTHRQLLIEPLKDRFEIFQAEKTSVSAIAKQVENHATKIQVDIQTDSAGQSAGLWLLSWYHMYISLRERDGDTTFFEPFPDRQVDIGSHRTNPFLRVFYPYPGLKVQATIPEIH